MAMESLKSFWGKASEATSTAASAAGSVVSIGLQSTGEAISNSSTGVEISNGGSHFLDLVRVQTLRIGSSIETSLNSTVHGRLGMKMNLGNAQWQDKYDSLQELRKTLLALSKLCTQFLEKIDGLCSVGADLSTVVMDHAGAGRDNLLSRDVMHYRMMMHDLTKKAQCTARGMLEEVAQRRVFGPIQEHIAAIDALHETCVERSAVENQVRTCTAELDIMLHSARDFDPAVVSQKQAALKAAKATSDALNKAVNDDLILLHNKRFDMVLKPYNGLKAVQAQFFLSCGAYIRECCDEDISVLRNPMLGVASSKDALDEDNQATASSADGFPVAVAAPSPLPVLSVSNLPLVPSESPGQDDDKIKL